MLYIDECKPSTRVSSTVKTDANFSIYIFLKAILVLQVDYFYADRRYEGTVFKLLRFSYLVRASRR